VPTSPSGPGGPGKRCAKHLDVELYAGECWACEKAKYHATHGGDSE
jgi:hypothetical protein